MDKYTAAIILTTIGFFTLAALLLVPVWRFLGREEKAAEAWTEETTGQETTEEPTESPETTRP